MSFNPHIVIATTFRDFVGSKNDLIQNKFLESLERQSYKNFTLVVTIFKEKNVKEIVASRNVNAFFVNSNIISGKKFSLSDVVYNGLQYASAYDFSSVLWTTCDVVFPEDFIKIVAENSKGNVVLSSHPHVMMAECDHIGSNQNKLSSLASGFDLIVYGTSTVKNDKLGQILYNYRFYDWGIFEHFLIATATVLKAKKINLFNIVKLFKIENDRSPGHETVLWLKSCWLENKVVFDRFLQDYSLPTHYYNLVYCHKRFQKISWSIYDVWRWRADYIFYYNYVIKSKISSVLPQKLKLIIKRIV